MLEPLLDIQFDIRESAYQQESISNGGNRALSIYVKRNVDLFDGEPAEIPFLAHQILCM